MYIRFDVACRKHARTLNEGAREGAFPKRTRRTWRRRVGYIREIKKEVARHERDSTRRREAPSSLIDGRRIGR